MASLLVDLHRAGVYWGDCSLANTLFRRDGDKIQAYLVDAETSEIHPGLSDGQRAYDLDILVENVGFGLADLGAMQGREDAFEDAVEAAESVRQSYRALWSELHDVKELSSGDRQAIRARIRRLNDLGFAVDEISLSPTSSGESVDLRVAVASRRFHARELARLTGLVALEGQARLLLNDLHEYQAWLEGERGAPLDPSDAADRWLEEVFEPVVAVLRPDHRARPRPDPGVLRRARGEVAAVRGRGTGRRSRGGPSTPTCRSVLPRRRTPPSRSTSTGAGGSTSRATDPRAAGAPRLYHRGMVTTGSVATGSVIEVRGLVKRYGDLVAVDGIDFDGRARRGLRPARAERRGQDDDGRDPRGPARAGQRPGEGPRGRRRDRRRRAQATDRGQPPDRCALSEADGRRGHRPVPELLPEPAADR